MRKSLIDQWNECQEDLKAFISANNLKKPDRFFKSNTKTLEVDDWRTNEFMHKAIGILTPEEVSILGMLRVNSNAQPPMSLINKVLGVPDAGPLLAGELSGAATFSKSVMSACAQGKLSAQDIAELAIRMKHGLGLTPELSMKLKNLGEK